MKMVEIYNKYSDVKQINKKNLTQQEKLIIHQYSGKECNTIFKEIDNDGLIKAFVSNLNIITTDVEKVSYELQYLGYSSMIVDSPYYGVEDIELNDYGTPYVKLYRIATGESLTFKIDKKWYNQFTTEYNGKLEQGDILDITLQEKPKKRKVDDEWVEVGTELVITAFCRE